MSRSTHTDAAGLSAGLSQPVASGRRWLGLAVAVPCWAVLIAAAWLRPAAAGQGTHEQLGIPPCSFLMQTGWPCPSCGMTTSVAAMARGRLGLAFGAHPFGVVLFLAVAVTAAAGTIELLTARAALRRLRPGLWWVWVGLVALLAGWGYKAGAGYLHGQYPLPGG